MSQTYKSDSYKPKTCDTLRHMRHRHLNFATLATIRKKSVATKKRCNLLNISLFAVCDTCDTFFWGFYNVCNFTTTKQGVNFNRRQGVEVTDHHGNQSTGRPSDRDHGHRLTAGNVSRVLTTATNPTGSPSDRQRPRQPIHGHRQHIPHPHRLTDRQHIPAATGSPSDTLTAGRVSRELTTGNQQAQADHPTPSQAGRVSRVLTTGNTSHRLTIPHTHRWNCGRPSTQRPRHRLTGWQGVEGTDYRQHIPQAHRQTIPHPHRWQCVEGTDHGTGSTSHTDRDHGHQSTGHRQHIPAATNQQPQADNPSDYRQRQPIHRHRQHIRHPHRWQGVEGTDHRQHIPQARHLTPSPLELWHTIRHRQPAPPRELTTIGSTSHTLTAGTVADHPTDRQRPRHRLTGWQYVEGIDHRQPIRQADHPTGSPLELWHTIRPTQTTATNPQAQAAHPTPSTEGTDSHRQTIRQADHPTGSPLELWRTIRPTPRHRLTDRQHIPAATNQQPQAAHPTDTDNGNQSTATGKPSDRQTIPQAHRLVECRGY